MPKNPAPDSLILDAPRAAEVLLAARRQLRPLPELPGDCRPRDLADGYRIQAECIPNSSCINVAQPDKEHIAQRGERGYPTMLVRCRFRLRHATSLQPVKVYQQG